MGFLTGSNKSQSSNVNNGMLSGLLSPVVGGAQTAMQGIQSFLSGDATGFNKYKQNAGYDWTAKQGAQGITGAAAARGLLNSGATGKGLTSYSQNLSNQFANDYMKNLLGQGQLGVGAGGVLAQSGQQSSSKSKKGLMDYVNPFQVAGR